MYGYDVFDVYIFFVCMMGVWEVINGGFFLIVEDKEVNDGGWKYVVNMDCFLYIRWLVRIFRMEVEFFIGVFNVCCGLVWL